MIRQLTTILFTIISINAFAQKQLDDYFIPSKINKATEIKNQAESGTCWSFAATSLIESSCINKDSTVEVSEMFTARNIYIEKAKNYILRQGATQFSQGSQAHDLLNSYRKYGAVPRSIYPGLQNGETFFNHDSLYNQLKKYLDSLIEHKPIPDNWLDHYIDLLDKKLGKAPVGDFWYRGKMYTALSYAEEYLKADPKDYITITSFTHHLYYNSFVLESPYNWSNGLYYNVGLQTLLNITNSAIHHGYTVLWNGDVSNNHFMPYSGLALNLDDSLQYDNINPDMKEIKWDETERTRLYQNLTTTVDHVMHIIGTVRTKKGKTFYKVKNSWGEIGPSKGYLYMSEDYFAMNTVSITLLKVALDYKYSFILHPMQIK
ncbi:C1 family peptidase [Ferruginibacter sp. SUN002]|uniref:C1 family peptidase n=1 Tax=Ferruginibacter sp. SUN002 TaxID=2937789 RepID=UPI003D36617D